MKRHSLTKITAIGSTAYSLLQEGQNGLVVGRTSAGVFIEASSDRILYLTLEPNRGPLTINLSGKISSLDGIENGMQVAMGVEELSIPDIDLHIEITHREKWYWPVPDAKPRSFEARNEILRSFAAEVLTQINEDDFPEIFLWLKTLARGGELSESKPGSMVNSLLHLQELTREGDVSKAGEVCQELLGRGEGLTPAGDDLLLGWLLGLNRWKHALLPNLDLQPLNEVIIQAAYQKTTTVSANLLECAAKGEGDERLLAVLDAIMCEAGEQENLITNLLSWGSTSGAYVFCGIGVAISK